MRTSFFALTAFLLVAATAGSDLSAQSYVLPNTMNATEGDYVGEVFRQPPARAISCYTPLVVPWTSSTTLRGVQFRADINYSQQSTHFAMTAEVEARLSTTGSGVPPFMASRSFIANWGSDVAVVVPRQWFAFPRFTPGPNGPAAWPNCQAPSTGICMPFAAPFVTSGREVMLDVKCYATSTRNAWAYDTMSNPGTLNYGTYSLSGTGCPTTTRMSGAAGYPGDVVLAFITAAQTNAPAAAWVGTSTTSWPPLTLPFTFPGTSCTIYTDVAFSALGTTTATGYARIAIGAVPRLPSFIGATLYLQGAVQDASQVFGFGLTNLKTEVLGSGAPIASGAVAWGSNTISQSAATPWDADSDDPHGPGGSVSNGGVMIVRSY